MPASIPSPAAPAFLEFAASVQDPALVAEVARRSGLAADLLHPRLTTALAEAAQTLRVLAGAAITTTRPVLEIGAGLGLTAAFLAGCGFDVAGLEPGGVGFEEHSALARHLAEVAGWTYRLLPIGVEALDPAVHDTYALVYSNNVLEHVPDLTAAFRAMAGVLDEDGVMVHSCPNYSIPYEPHLARPLVPFRPRATARLLPASERDAAVWRSLNFVRARDVRAQVRTLGLDVHFRSGALASSLHRLRTDPEFRSRHGALARAGTLAHRLGAGIALRHLPAGWSTPMDFLACRPGTPPAVVDAWLAPVPAV